MKLSGPSTPDVTDFTQGTALSGAFTARQGYVLANAVPEDASNVITEPRLGASIDPPSPDSVVVFAHDASAGLSSDRLSTTQDDDAADPDLSSLVHTDGPTCSATRERSSLIQLLNAHREQAASSLEK